MKFEDIAQLTVDTFKDVKKEGIVIQRVRKPSRRFVSRPKSLDEKGRRREKILQHVGDMIDHSSLHGLNYICDKRFTLRRIVWFVVTVAAFGIAVWKVF